MGHRFDHLLSDALGTRTAVSSPSSWIALSMRPCTDQNFDHRETVRRSNHPPLPIHRQLLFWVKAQREVRKFSHNQANYSYDLLNTVRACLYYHRARRPSATRLLRNVRRRMRRHLDGFDTYGTASRIPWNKRERLVGNLKDFWAAGTEVEVRMDRV